MSKQMNKKQLSCFEFYYAQGDKRNLTTLADKTGVSRVSLSRWKSMFNWDELCRVRDEQIYEQIRQENSDDIKSTVKLYRSIIKDSVATYIKRLREGKIIVDNVKDFTRLVELELKLLGFEHEMFDQKLEQNIVSDETNDTIRKLRDAVDEYTNHTNSGGDTNE